MVPQTEKLNKLIHNYPEFYSQQTPQLPIWLKELRTLGSARFEQLGVPTLKDEEWKYTDLSGLSNRAFYLPERIKFEEICEFKSLLNPQDFNIVFINGLWAPEFCNIQNLPAGLNITKFNSATLQSLPETKILLEQYSTNLADAFIALNDSLAHDGVCIQFAPKTICTKLIHIIHVNCFDKKDAALAQRSFISLGQAAQAEVLETHLSCTPISYLANALTDIFLAPAANLRYCKAQNEGPEAFHIGTTRAWLKKDSHLDSCAITLGSKMTRNNINIRLEETGASAILNGLYTIRGDQHVDNHTCVDHRAPNCTSNQLYKGILNERSRGVFNGKIFVQQIAQQTNSYQLNKTLLLGKEARIDTKPQLEIFADDVKCTHGATIGQLNEDELFYLETRGIARKDATKMLCKGFAYDVIDRIQSPAITKKLDYLLQPTFAILT